MSGIKDLEELGHLSVWKTQICGSGKKGTGMKNEWRPRIAKDNSLSVKEQPGKHEK